MYRISMGNGITKETVMDIHDDIVMESCKYADAKVSQLTKSIDSGFNGIHQTVDNTSVSITEEVKILNQNISDLAKYTKNRFLSIEFNKEDNYNKHIDEIDQKLAVIEEMIKSLEEKIDSQPSLAKYANIGYKYMFSHILSIKNTTVQYLYYFKLKQN